MVHLTTALDAASAVPLYEQLYQSLAQEMRTGALAAGTRMPGKRRLAAELSRIPGAQRLLCTGISGAACPPDRGARAAAFASTGAAARPAGAV